MENAILKVLNKDKEIQEKISTLDGLSNEYKKRIEEKEIEIKRKIWDEAHKYVTKQKEMLQKDLHKGEDVNKQQAEELLKQLKEKFTAGKEQWEKELICRVTTVEEENLP